jgi:hypothetical protein
MSAGDLRSLERLRYPNQLYGWRRQLCARPQLAATLQRCGLGPGPVTCLSAGTTTLPSARSVASRSAASHWLFAGSESWPHAWLADVLAQINDHDIEKLEQLLPLELEGGGCQARGVRIKVRHFNRLHRARGLYRTDTLQEEGSPLSQSLYSSTHPRLVKREIVLRGWTCASGRGSLK